MNRIYITLIIVWIVMTGCADKSALQKNQLQGAWRVTAMCLISANKDTMKVPINESLFIFGEGYYSIVYAFGDKSSPTYAERWHPSDSEKVSRYSSLIVNTGSYHINGSHLYARPLFALAPEFVKGQAIFSFRFVKETLELIWEKSIAFDGLEYPSAGTVTLLKLVRVK
ncbi:hypothetical protein JW835_05125 [bacterium]|nr:hypothetical protein [bacterium]